MEHHQAHRHVAVQQLNMQVEHTILPSSASAPGLQLVKSLPRTLL
jgi:hypothetical protein